MPPRGTNTSDEIKPVYVVTGSEGFLKREAIRRISERVLGKADRSLAYTEYDGAAAATELAVVLDDLRTLPFLADRRLVLLYDADTFITKYRQALEDYVGAPSPTGVLLIECKSLPANTRLYKRAQQAGEVIKCEPVKSHQAPGWVISRARESHGVTIDARGAATLVNQIGDDLGLLDNELQKLALYVGDRKTITAADVETLVGTMREEKVWGILSAVAAGNEAQAIAIWEQVWETDRAAEGRAVAGLAYKVRQLLNAKRAQEAGASMQELATILMAWGNDARVRAELGAFSTAQVEGMLCRLLEADVSAKTGAGSVRTLIESFIVETCRARQGRRTA